MKITVVQEYEIEVSNEYKGKGLDVFLKDFNTLYDLDGKNIVNQKNAKYMSTFFTQIDGVDLHEEIEIKGN